MPLLTLMGLMIMTTQRMEMTTQRLLQRATQVHKTKDDDISLN